MPSAGTAVLTAAAARGMLQSVSVQRGIEALRLLLATDIPAATGHDPIDLGVEDLAATQLGRNMMLWLGRSLPCRNAVEEYLRDRGTDRAQRAQSALTVVCWAGAHMHGLLRRLPEGAAYLIRKLHKFEQWRDEETSDNARLAPYLHNALLMLGGAIRACRADALSGASTSADGGTTIVGAFDAELPVAEVDMADKMTVVLFMFLRLLATADPGNTLRMELCVADFGSVHAQAESERVESLADELSRLRTRVESTEACLGDLSVAASALKKSRERTDKLETLVKEALARAAAAEALAMAKDVPAATALGSANNKKTTAAPSTSPASKAVAHKAAAVAKAAAADAEAARAEIAKVRAELASAVDAAARRAAGTVAERVDLLTARVSRLDMFGDRLDALASRTEGLDTLNARLDSLSSALLPDVARIGALERRVTSAEARVATAASSAAASATANAVKDHVSRRVEAIGRIAGTAAADVESLKTQVAWLLPQFQSWVNMLVAWNQLMGLTAAPYAAAAQPPPHKAAPPAPATPPVLMALGVPAAPPQQ